MHNIAFILQTKFSIEEFNKIRYQGAVRFGSVTPQGFLAPTPLSTLKVHTSYGKLHAVNGMPIAGRSNPEIQHTGG